MIITVGVPYKYSINKFYTTICFKNNYFFKLVHKYLGKRAYSSQIPFDFLTLPCVQIAMFLPPFSWSHSSVAIGTVITSYSYPCISDLQTALLQLRPRN